MRGAVYKTRPAQLDLKTNLEDDISTIHNDREKGAMLIVFPERALTRYFVGQRYHKMALKMMDPREIKKPASASKEITDFGGCIEDFRFVFFCNSALIALEGAILFTYRELQRILHNK